MRKYLALVFFVGAISPVVLAAVKHPCNLGKNNIPLCVTNASDLKNRIGIISVVDDRAYINYVDGTLDDIRSYVDVTGLRMAHRIQQHMTSILKKRKYNVVRLQLGASEYHEIYGKRINEKSDKSRLSRKLSDIIDRYRLGSLIVVYKSQATPFVAGQEGYKRWRIDGFGVYRMGVYRDADESSAKIYSVVKVEVIDGATKNTIASNRGVSVLKPKYSVWSKQYEKRLWGTGTQFVVSTRQRLIQDIGKAVLLSVDNALDKLQIIDRSDPKRKAVSDFVPDTGVTVDMEILKDPERRRGAEAEPVQHNGGKPVSASGVK